MSANPSIVVDIEARLDPLTKGLDKAAVVGQQKGEAIAKSVADGAKKSPFTADAGSKLGDAFMGKFGAALAVGAVSGVLEKAARKMGDTLASGGSWAQAGAAAGKEFVTALESTPVIGAAYKLGEGIATAMNLAGLKDELAAALNTSAANTAIVAKMTSATTADAIAADTKRLEIVAAIAAAMDESTKVELQAKLKLLDLEKETADAFAKASGLTEHADIERAEAALKHAAQLKQEMILTEKARALWAIKLEGMLYKEDRRREDREADEKRAEAAAKKAADAEKERAKENAKMLEAATEEREAALEAVAEMREEEEEALRAAVMARAHEGATALGSFRFREGSDQGAVAAGVRDAASIGIQQKMATLLDRVAKATESLLMLQRETALA